MIYNALSNGNAPKDAQIGDTIRTAGGNYTVVAPYTAGASFNPSSGFWSIKDNSPDYLVNARSMVDFNNSQMTKAAESANEFSRQSSALAMAFNAAEAEKSRQWQENMSNTAHQREVLDLQAAGLNPVLSSTLGGASTPAGATATGSSFAGQKSDVDTQLLGLYGQILQTELNNATNKDIAKLNAETALQQSAISSAATQYAANQSAQAAMFGALQSAAAARYGADANLYGILNNPNSNIGALWRFGNQTGILPLITNWLNPSNSSSSADANKRYNFDESSFTKYMGEQFLAHMSGDGANYHNQWKNWRNKVHNPEGKR